VLACSYRSRRPLSSCAARTRRSPRSRTRSCSSRTTSLQAAAACSGWSTRLLTSASRSAPRRRRRQRPQSSSASRARTTCAPASCLHRKSASRAALRRVALRMPAPRPPAALRADMAGRARAGRELPRQHRRLRIGPPLPVLGGHAAAAAQGRVRAGPPAERGPRLQLLPQPRVCARTARRRVVLHWRRGCAVGALCGAVLRGQRRRRRRRALVGHRGCGTAAKAACASCCEHLHVCLLTAAPVSFALGSIPLASLHR
jgi:hypothetical protein